MSGGVPRRPACAVTMPATLTTVPMGMRREFAIGRIVDDGNGTGDVDGLGAGVVVGVDVGVGLEEALGAGATLGSGVGVGDGGGASTMSSPCEVAWSR